MGMLQHLTAALKPNGKLVVVELYSAGIRANLGHMALTERAFTIPEIIFVAGTRVALGVGVGLLLSDRLSKDERKAVGWALLAVGVLTTIPLVSSMLAKPPAAPI